MIISELYYMFSAIWQQKIYTGYGYAVAGYVMLLVSVSCASMLMTYLKLESELHEWCWTSLQPTAIVSVSVLMFCMYFYAQCSPLTKSDFASYFAFSCVVSCGSGACVGALSFISSWYLVHMMYSSKKYCS